MEEQQLDPHALRAAFGEYEREAADRQEYQPSARLLDPANQELLATRTEEFRAELKKFRLNRDDRQSPRLGDGTPEMNEIIEILVRGFKNCVTYFDRAATLPLDRPQLKAITRTSQPLRMEQELVEAKAIRDYAGDKEQTVINLLGSTVNRAITTSIDMGLLPSTDRRFFRGFDSHSGKRAR